MKLFVPEVLQSSAMDCGPACLKSMLEGVGGTLSYARLREACQTAVDGTSIDEMEEVALALGYDAEQVVLPEEALFSTRVCPFPAITAIVRPDGALHFVVLWRRVGRYVQVMDPARGRHWIPFRQLREKLHRVRVDVGASDWRDWVSSPQSQEHLEERGEALGASPGEVRGWVHAAAASPSWRGFGILDASLRFVQRLVDHRALASGRSAVDAVAALCLAQAEDDSALPLIDERDWTVRPSTSEDDEPQLTMTGAVFLRVRDKPPQRDGSRSLPAILEAAAAEPPAKPLRELWSNVSPPERRILAGAFVAVLLLGPALVIEGVLLRGLLEVWPYLGLGPQRVAAVAGLLSLVVALFGLEFAIERSVLRAGRSLELRLRQRFMEKLPRIHDRFFSSRPVSDMAYRVHALRSLPEVAAAIARSVTATVLLLILVVSIVALAPMLLSAATAVGAASLLIPLAFQRLLGDRVHRQEESTAALASLELDAIRGSQSLRGLGAWSLFRQTQAAPLDTWTRTTTARYRLEQRLELLLSAVGILGAVAMVSVALPQPELAGQGLLVTYWALSIPWLGLRLAEGMRRLPVARSLARRLFEPLAAPSVRLASETEPQRPAGIRFDGVSVVAAGHPILQSISASIAPGEHIAIVGASGSGKSSLLSVLLGWHEPVQGTVELHGAPLTAERISAFRRETVWIDPAVQLWNASMLSNLEYGSDETSVDVASVLEDAELGDVTSRLAEGVGSCVGDGGSGLSGGEGQRLRVGRGFANPSPSAVLLDEPFRGLDRTVRRRLLQRARARWCATTLLCVTHDLEDTRAFDRVWVIEAGRLVEDGAPDQLAQRPDSRYARMLAEARTGAAEVWGSDWRRLHVSEGSVRE